MDIAQSIPKQNPLRGAKALWGLVLATILGVGVVLYFVSPSEIVSAVTAVRRDSWFFTTFFFLVACLTAAERWRACLSYRVGRAEAFCSLGACMAGNLWFPGRLGEPLRVYLLSRCGLPGAYGTSGVLKERIADQVLRLLFMSLAIVLVTMEGGKAATGRLGGGIMATCLLFLALKLAIKYHQKLATLAGRIAEKTPLLDSEKVSRLVQGTLLDLADTWVQPGGKSALVLGLMTWLFFTLHTEHVLVNFVSTETFAMALLLMALTPTTAPTQPGIFHGLAVASLVLVGMDKQQALLAAVVLHLMQVVLFTIWGVFGWLVLSGEKSFERASEPNDPADEATEK